MHNPVQPKSLLRSLIGARVVSGLVFSAGLANAQLGSLTGSLPLLGGGGLPVVGGLLGGSTEGGLPIVGGLLGGATGGAGGLPVVGSLPVIGGLGGAGGLPVVGSLPVLGGTTTSTTTGGGLIGNLTSTIGGVQKTLGDMSAWLPIGS